MVTLETIAEIEEDGTLRVQAPPSVPKGPRRVLIVIDDAQGSEPARRLPDLTEFRAGLAARPYPGNSIVDMRDEER